MIQLLEMATFPTCSHGDGAENNDKASATHLPHYFLRELKPRYLLRGLKPLASFSFSGFKVERYQLFQYIVSLRMLIAVRIYKTGIHNKLKN